MQWANSIQCWRQYPRTHHPPSKALPTRARISFHSNHARTRSCQYASRDKHGSIDHCVIFFETAFVHCPFSLIRTGIPGNPLGEMKIFEHTSWQNDRTPVNFNDKLMNTFLTLSMMDPFSWKKTGHEQNDPLKFSGRWGYTIRLWPLKYLSIPWMDSGRSISIDKQREIKPMMPG